MILKKLLLFLAVSAMTLTACGKESAANAPTVDQMKAEAVAKNLQQALKEHTAVEETKVLEETERASETEAESTAVSVTEHDEPDIDDLAGTWLKVGGEIEGDIWEAIPGNFEILVFTEGTDPLDGTETMLVDLESRDYQGELSDCFYQERIETLEQPIYEGCGNEEWSVRIGAESERDQDGRRISEEYYATLLDQNTLLKQHFFTSDGAPAVSYQTFKRVFPGDRIEYMEIPDESILDEWVLEAYVDENGNELPLPTEFTDLSIHLSGSAEWYDEKRAIDFEYSGDWKSGRGGTFLWQSDDDYSAWFAGAFAKEQTDSKSEWIPKLHLYHEGGWLCLREKEVPEIPILGVMKTTLSREEYAENSVISSAVRDDIRLCEEDAERYPELAKALDVLTREEIDEMEESVLLMKEMYEDGNPSFHSAFVDDEMLFVQRADSQVLSIREEFYSYSGGAHPMYGALGYNFDTQTGKKLELDDVVTDFDQMLNLVEQKLYEIYDKETFYTDVETYFDMFTQEDLCWTLGYQGITFQFIPYTLAPYAAGMQEVTIWFNEVPELFVEKYTKVPENGYAVSIPFGREYEFDRNTSDGWTDLLCVSAESSNDYAFDKLTITLNGNTQTDTDICLYEMSAYLVCTGVPGESNVYLYVYGGLEDGHKMYVYDLNQDEVKRCDLEENVFFQGAWYSGVEEFEVYYEPVFTDPTNFTMHSKMWTMGLFLGEKEYYVDPFTGEMQAKKRSYSIPEDTWPIISKVSMEMESLADGETVEVPAGSTFYYKRTDGDSYVDVCSDEDMEYRIRVDNSGEYTTVNGMSVEECFDGVSSIW